MRDISYYKAAPTSRANLSEYAFEIRKAIGFDSQLYLPVVEFMEYILPEIIPGFFPDICHPSSLPDRYAETIADKNGVYIRIREDVYDAAAAGDGRSRFTIAHEIGHSLLHTNATVVLHRDKISAPIRAFENPEWQANTFAGEFLAPSRLIVNESVFTIANKCKISNRAAEIQLDAAKKYYKKETGNSRTAPDFI